MARILVTEEIAENGLAGLRDAGHDVDVQLGLTADPDLVVVGRAGIGLDNVDVAAATTRGVMVVNAPQSNILSAAEHAMALLLAQARNVPQAHTALKAGKWERSKWEGVELHGKVLGVVGLGRVGALVAQRASAFGMKLVAYDPYVSPDRARQMGVELMTLDEVVAHADFVTVHLPKTPETVGLIGAELLAKAKPGLRIINTARGGIIDEAALAAAVAAGTVAGAGIDVFAEEPTTESPLFALDSVVVTPLLGASTAEAQDKAGITIAEQVLLALAGDFVPYAVNVNAAEASETVRPFLPLAERLGRLYAQLNQALPAVLDLEYQGALAEYDTRILTLSVLKGVFGAGTEEPVSYVNAPQLAEERGVEVRETTTTAAHEYVNLVVVRGGDHSIAGTLSGPRGEARITNIDGHDIDVPPANHMLVVHNDDQPGQIGFVGTVLGDAGVNIDDMHVGRSDKGATMVLAIGSPVPAEVLDRLRAADGILSVYALTG